jgi:hypothetical protein
MDADIIPHLLFNGMVWLKERMFCHDGNGSEKLTTY